MNTTAKHTPGAIRAAEAITGGTYGGRKRYPTAYGEKTVAGVADLIDRETAARELLEACEQLLIECSDLRDQLWEACDRIPEYKPTPSDKETMARAAIAKAKGE